MSEENNNNPVGSNNNSQPENGGLSHDNNSSSVASEQPIKEIKNESNVVDGAEKKVESQIVSENQTTEKVEVKNAAVGSNNSGFVLKEALGKINIVRILVILAIVWALFYLANQKPEEGVELFDEETNITVSDEVEDGVVNIIEENSGAIAVPGSNRQPSDPSKMIVTVYLSNTLKDPNASDCGRVFPLEKETAKREGASIVNTVLALLEPLTAEEKEAGYVSTIPEGTILNNVRISDSKVATVNFFGNLNKAAGSCAVTAIRAQITETLLQFNSIDSVIICIDGNCKQDEILQP
jgi:spore germination protein GerM